MSVLETSFINENKEAKNLLEDDERQEDNELLGDDLDFGEKREEDEDSGRTVHKTQHFENQYKIVKRSSFDLAPFQ